MWVEKGGAWNDRKGDLDGYDRPFVCKKTGTWGTGWYLFWQPTISYHPIQEF